MYDTYTEYWNISKSCLEWLSQTSAYQKVKNVTNVSYWILILIKSILKPMRVYHPLKKYFKMISLVYILTIYNVKICYFKNKLKCIN